MPELRPQIVIPMSGFGERFRAAGHRVPKPLIEVDGKPIIEHVVEMFPGADSITFVCNQDHLDNPDYAMAATLQRIAPHGHVVGIPPHKLGPVHAVVQVLHGLDRDRPVIVNYCDFTCYWHYDDFIDFVAEAACDGAIPCYRGFHPHSLGSTKYAYVCETNGWAFDIQEKNPFTSTPMNEYASSGTYYFRSVDILESAIAEMQARELTIGGEYYASLAYKPLMDNGLSVAVYPLQHFMQWGTPQDLVEYKYWSSAFDHLADRSFDRSSKPAHGVALVPMAGLGKRYSDAGYETPKPLIPVSGEPMVLQAVADMPAMDKQLFVQRQDMPGLAAVQNAITSVWPDAEFLVLDRVTDGQARTCLEAVRLLDPDTTITIVACDNGALFQADMLAHLLSEDGADVVVWGAKGYPFATKRPASYGWVDADPYGHIHAVSTKVAPPDPVHTSIVIGAFTFRRAADFIAAAERMIGRDAKVNGEFYVDVMINDAIALGLDCRCFDVDSYLGWGTPDELATFEYWQSCFDKWPSHSYRLEDDHRIPPSAVAELRHRFAWSKPSRPDTKP